MRGTLVALEDLTAADLRHLAGIKDGEPARLQSGYDERLRRHLVRLAALMPDGQRQAIQLLLRRHHPALVLREHPKAFLAARALRAELPEEQKGWLYRPRDVAECKDDPSDDAPDATQLRDTARFAHEVARLERRTPDAEQFVTKSYALANAAGITPETARPIIVAALRARNHRQKENRRRAD